MRIRASGRCHRAGKITMPAHQRATDLAIDTRRGSWWRRPRRIGRAGIITGVGSTSMLPPPVAGAEPPDRPTTAGLDRSNLGRSALFGGVTPDVSMRVHEEEHRG